MTQEMQRAGAAPLAKAGAPRMGSLDGEDRDDVILPRVHVYQGLPAEQKQYGSGYSIGDFINTLTMEKIEARKFIPILGYVEFIKWKLPRGTGFEYKERDRTKIPPDDLAWGDADIKHPKGRPPFAEKYINWVVLFEGFDFPIVFSFYRTSLMTGKTINTLEKSRAGKGSGFYAIDIKERHNDAGDWVIPIARPLGSPPDDLMAQAKIIFDSLSGVTVDTNVEAEPDDGGEFNPDAV